MTIRPKSRIVITGIGPISSTGIGKYDFWEGLYSKKLNIQLIECKIGKNIWAKFRKHIISNFDISKFNIQDYLLRDIENWKGGEIDNDLLYMIAAAKLALDDSRIKYSVDNNRIGLIVTHENLGLEDYFSRISNVSFDYFKKEKNRNACKKRFYDFLYKKMSKASYELQTFMHIFHVAKVLSIHGYTLFVNNACASGAYALEEAKRLISSGTCRTVIVVGADIPGVYKYLWFQLLNMHSPDGIMKPFCDNANGFLMGEGATGIVLESYSSAKKRSAHIYGEYLGGGFSSDSWKVSLPSFSGRLYKIAILEALKFAKVTPREIDLIVPHGVGTLLSDKVEIKVMREVFRSEFRRKKIVALKPYFGHNLGGNVLLEVAAILMMFEKKCVLPTLNIEGGRLISDVNITTEMTREDVSCVLKSTCAFAGFNSAIILRRLLK